MSIILASARMFWATVTLFFGIVWRKYHDHRLTVRDSLGVCASVWTFPPRPGTWGRPPR